MNAKTKFTKQQIQRYLRAGYRLVGKNTAVEICRWTRTALKGERLCYKRWYGVSSHRCVQMTPNLNFCNFACSFCWRIHEEGRFKMVPEWDDPKEIVDGIIKAQRELLIGYKGNPKVSQERFLEAMFPRHVAISLDGEPTMYPYLAELIKEIKNRGMTAFLVTNGSIPARLKELLDKNAEPTNLYISVYGPNEEIFLKTSKPLIPKAWDLVLESLGLMEEFSCRTVFRMTLVKGLNMVEPEGYAKLIDYANSKFVELKGYTWVGESQKRLSIQAMPKMEELMDFASKIAELTGYQIKVLDEKSRIVMLVKDLDVWEWNLKLIKQQRKIEQEHDKKWRGKIKDFRFKTLKSMLSSL